MTRIRIAYDETAPDDAPACVALANSIAWRGTAREDDRVRDAAGLLAWARRWRIAPAAELDRLQDRIGTDGESISKALRDFRQIRDDLYPLLAAAAAGGAPRPSDVERIERRAARLLNRLRLRAVSGGLQLQIDSRANPWRFWEAPVVLSAIAVLGGDVRGRLRVCADTRGCHWMFVDTTRNASRRYCSDDDCGNYARQRRFRERHRAALTAAARDGRA